MGKYSVSRLLQMNEVALYRAQKLPDVWQREAALLESFEGVDSSVIQFDGLWWLFCGDRRNRPNLNLFIFYAENLTGAWVAHRQNPVKSDVRSSRPAGTPFIHDGCLFRPSQDSSRGYGSGIVINRVVELSREAFREEEVALLEPDSSGPYKHGLHTICKVGDKTIVDGKARVVRLASMRNKLAKIVSSRMQNGIEITNPKGRKIRVLQVLWTANFGGVERRVCDLCGGLEESGSIECGVLFAKSQGPLYAQFDKLAIEKHVDNLRHGVSLSTKRYRRFTETFRRYDVLHLHFFNPFIALA